ncbi:MAG: hypothetical protein AAFY60_13005, partial [Myxococcota bacterium]
MVLGVLTAACVGAPIPQLGPQSDISEQSDRIVALSRSGLRAVAVRTRAHQPELILLDRDDGTHRRLSALGDHERKVIQDADGREQLVSAVFNSSARDALLAMEFDPVTALEADMLALPSGMLRFDGERLLVEADGREVVLKGLGAQRPPSRLRWLVSAQRNRIALELVYDEGPVDTRSSWLLALNRIEAEQISDEAFELFRAGDVREASKRWRDALKRYGNHGTSRYNLACAEARMGDEREALRHLRLAISLDPYRYKALAKIDSDLDGLRRNPEFHELVF